MGQTLTHGIYLPDEGERNCYNGLAANWSILDGAVGTVAEHTTQIAGKAPAVHTHTKSDITDLFNSANVWTGNNTYTATIKYKTSYTLGNPPQSSDAQSAIMVTDSAGTNYLAQINTYQDTALSGLRFTIRDKFDSDGFSPSGSTRNKHFYFLQNTLNRGYLQWEGFVNNNIHPLETNAYNLGTLAYQWKSVYAQSYYHNGVAWGLDKENTWTGANSFYKSIQIHGGRNAYIMPEFSASYSGLAFGTVGFNQSFKFGDWVDNNSTIGINTSNAYVEIYAGLDSSDNINKVRLNPVNTTVAELGTSAYQWKSVYAQTYYYNGTAWGLDKANTWSAINQYSREIQLVGDRSSFIAPMWEGAGSGMAFLVSDVSKAICFGIYTDDANNNNRKIVDGTKGRMIIRVGEKNSETYLEVEPRASNAALGNSTNKWKSLNGINPGALSIPNLASDGYIDLSDNISANTEYSYTPTVDGWLALYCQTTGFHAKNAVGIFTGGGQSNSYRGACSVTSAINLPRANAYHGAVMLPVKAGIPYLCWITIDSSTTLSTKRLYFYKNNGNV